MTAEQQKGGTKGTTDTDENEKDSFTYTLTKIVESIFGRTQSDDDLIWPPLPPPPSAPFDYQLSTAFSELLAHNARTAGNDPVDFKRGVKAGLAVIERTAAGKVGHAAHGQALAALDVLKPHNDSHGAGIEAVRDAVRELGSDASFGLASRSGGAGGAR